MLARLETSSAMQSVISMVSKWILVSNYICFVSDVSKARDFARVVQSVMSNCPWPFSGSWFLITFVTFQMLAKLETSSVVQSVMSMASSGNIVSYSIWAGIGRRQSLFKTSNLLIKQRRSHWLRFLFLPRGAFLIVSSHWARAQASIMSHSPLCLATEMAECYWSEYGVISITGHHIKYR
jgi:hypothetical protein